MINMSSDAHVGLLLCPAKPVPNMHCYQALPNKVLTAGPRIVGEGIEDEEQGIMEATPTHNGCVTACCAYFSYILYIINILCHVLQLATSCMSTTFTCSFAPKKLQMYV